MTDVELELKLKSLVHEERRITKEIIKLLNEAEERKLHLERGFATLFDWLVRGFGYSESAAYRRIEAARMARAVPSVAEKIESGDLNLTNVAKARSAMRAQQKATGKKLSQEEQEQVISSIENKTSAEAEQVLFSLFPETSSSVHQEKIKPINDKTTRLTINLSNEALADIEWARHFLSHALPGAGLGEVIASVAKRFRDKNDPSRKNRRAKSNHQKDYEHSESDASVDSVSSPTERGGTASERAESNSAAEKPRSKAGARRVTFQRAEGRCEYVDPVTGNRCSSTYQVQTDHIIPRALGGADEIENYRCLCRQHNLLMAEKILGKHRANSWRESRNRQERDCCA